VPLVFNASPLLVKDPLTGEHLPWNPTPQRWIDGSVDNDLPMTRLAEMFNVNHFIVSQVNPHVVPFLSKDDHLTPGSDPKSRQKMETRENMEWVYTLTALAKDEALHRLHFMAELGIMPNLATKFRSILSQKYSGDINILPEMSMHDLPSLLSNPTVDFILRISLAGERATWPKLSRIRDRCAIELALDRAVHRLRTRVVFSESQKDLRKMRSSVAGLHIMGDGQTTARGGTTTAAASPSLTKGTLAAPQARQRRQSGGSVQMLMHRRQQLDGPCSESDDEVVAQRDHVQQSIDAPGPELQLDGIGSGAGGAGKPMKPKLRRAVKSYQQVSHRGSLSSVAPSA
jgi:TAG lipase/steryl ester hydrolase/phospholipase A2/LPA acyltransferase